MIAPPNEKPPAKDIWRALPFTIRFFYRAGRGSFIMAALGQLLLAPLLAVQVFAMKGLGDALLSYDKDQFLKWLIVLAGVAIGSAVLEYMQEVGADLLRYRVEYAIRHEGVLVMSRLPFSILEDSGFQRLRSGYLMHTSDIREISSQLFWQLYNIACLIGYGTVLLFLPWQVLVAIFVVIALRLINARRESQWTWSIFGKETREGRRIAYVENILGRPHHALQAIGWGLQKPMIRIWERFTNEIKEEQERKTIVMGRALSLSVMMQAVSMVIGLYLIFQSLLRHEITPGVMLVFIANYNQMWNALGRTFNQVRGLANNLPFVVLFKQFLELPLEKETGKAVPSKPLQIRFEDVWFRYEGSGQDILRGISLIFSEGDHIALIGLNGAGKSTLLKLLMGIYVPTHGRITVNGVDLATIKPSAWRRALAVMGQDQLIFDDTVREQVRYGDPAEKMDAKRLKRALAVSGFGDIAKDLPRGLDTHAGKQFAVPGDEPIELSGGQNQILAIARTMYREARIYIFDEPTSAVDAEKEERFFEALPDALQGKGIVFVSHRFSTLRRAERILVLDQGRIIEDGTHEELMYKKGRYAELFTLQARMYQ